MSARSSGSKWLRSLTASKQIILDSSSSVIQDIVDRQSEPDYVAKKVKHKQPVSIANFSPPQYSNLVPINLLHSIGLITTPIIPNLADLSSTWAIYRYFWAFASNSKILRLSNIAKEIDFHQKSLLSDEIGVGMVHWIMPRFFGGVDHIDFDVAIRHPKISQNMGISKLIRVGSAKPDYIFVTDNNRFAIVESKGSQGGRNKSLNQIVRGLEQVPSVRFADGTKADEYVLATSITNNLWFAQILTRN